MKCGICKKDIRNEYPAAIPLTHGQTRLELGLYHLDCLVRKLKKLLEEEPRSKKNEV